jgi:rfaE bifunctional protein kinase chain/domain
VTSTVASALQKFSNCRILVVGDMILDAYVYGQTLRVSREAPVLVVRKESKEYRLGGAANTALNLRALGANVEVVTGLGNDANGEVVRRMLQDAGMDIQGVVGAETTTSVKTRVMAGAAGTARQQVIRLDDEPEPLPEDVHQAITDYVSKRADKVDAIILSDYGQGVISQATIDLAVKLASENKIVCVDSRYRLDAFQGVTAITPNVPEAEAVVGFLIDSPEQAVRAGHALKEKLGTKAVLLTLGRGGMSLFTDDQVSHVDIVGEEEVTDVTGAGDTVMATFCLAVAAGLGMENAMRLANCAAGVTVNKSGAATCSPEELIDASTQASMELSPWDS